ncbi:MAG: S-layer family protein, partial [Rhizonema sp. PD38]|nr:S-layer family protein [Rhizonema sp. PD38]
ANSIWFAFSHIVFSLNSSNGANINIRARSLSLSDSAQVLTSTVLGTGNAGNIQINTDNDVSVNSGSMINAGTFGNGNAGNITIQSGGVVSFDGVGSNSYSQASSFVGAAQGFVVTGKGGDININAQALKLSNGALLNASTYGQGNAGNINVKAGSISLNDNASVQSSTFNKGNAGNLFLQVDDSMSLINSSFISSNVESGAIGNGGNIDVKSGSLSLINGSQIQTFIRQASQTANAGKGNAGSINIDVNEDFKLFGIGSDNIRSAVLSYVDSQAEGNGGNIDIKAGSIFLNDSAIIQSSTYGKGNAGNIQIQTNNLSTGRLSLLNDALIAAETFSPDGVGGNIKIEVGRLNAENGGQVSTGSGRQNQQGNFGRSGNLTVTAFDSIELDGLGNERRSGFFSETSSPNRAGDLKINTTKLVVRNGAGISSGASSSGSLGGDGGNLTINATESIDLISKSPIYYSAFTTEANGLGNAGDLTITTGRLSIRDGAQISAFVLPETIGNGGKINITADSLEVANGSQIGASTSGQGNAGNIIINARDRVSFDGSNGIFGSGIFSNVDEGGTGKGGDIRIITSSLSVTNAAAIVASSRGQGDAGNIQINASDSVNVSGNNPNTGYSSGLFTFTLPNSTGKGGNIILNANTLRVSKGGVVDARTRNDGKGGDITLKADLIELFNGGQIITTTSGTGSAGKINVNAGKQVIANGIDTTFNDRLSKIGGEPFINTNATSGFFVRSSSSGSAGDIEINSPKLSLDNQGRLIAESTSGNGGNINLQIGDLLLLRNNSLISATAGTDQAGGNGGNITINTPFIVAVPKENSDIIANAYSGKGGNINIRARSILGIEARPLTTPETNDITASSELGIQGQISIQQPDVQPTERLIELPNQVLDASNQIAQDCGRGRNAKPLGKFVVTGRSIPPNSLQPLNGTTSIAPLATLEGHLPNTSQAPIKTFTPPTAIIEAQGWVKTADGKIVLVALAPQATPSAPPTTACPNPS